jgi:hypothetical protein
VGQLMHIYDLKCNNYKERDCVNTYYIHIEDMTLKEMNYILIWLLMREKKGGRDRQTMKDVFIAYSDCTAH